ncbi:MAG TPA: helix-hairpin-helix domain-containing protein [Capsulimonadaceae bacterium]|jgi:general secretion pathway protein K
MRQRNGGYILIQALVAIAGILAFVAILAADQRAAVGVVQSKLAQRRADAAADSGVARALAVVASATQDLVQTSDDWATLGNNGADEFDLGDGATFRMQLVDAGSMVNVNTASQSQLLLLPITQEQVDCLLDWRSTGTSPRSDGAKDEYYNALPQPYNTKLGPLTTTDELLLVRQWTTADLYQPPIQTTSSQYPVDANGAALPLAALLTVDSGSPNTRADGTARVNFNVRNLSINTVQRLGIRRQLAQTISQRAQTRPYTSFSDLFQTPGLSTNDMRILLNAACFTTNSRLTGKINLNTATQGVLLTLPAMTPALAATIVTQQSTGFTTLGDLASLQGITPGQLRQLSDSFTIGGDTWTARIYGTSGGISVAYEAVVGLRNKQVQVVNLKRLSTSGVPAWWNWDADSTSTLDAGGS